jgi:hypothetical protein
MHHGKAVKPYGDPLGLSTRVRRHRSRASEPHSGAARTRARPRCGAEFRELDASGFQRRSPASFHTASTASSAAFAISPLSFAIVVSLNPILIARTA